MLRELLHLQQNEMAGRLAAVRLRLAHNGARGAGAEAIVREFLREHLPPEFRLGHGEVIDTAVRRSGQMDLVVLNRHHPYLGDLSEPGTFFIEGVACVGEVKSRLTGDDLLRTLRHCDRFKLLAPYFERNDVILGSSEADRDRFAFKRPYFLFAFESDLTLQTTLERVARYYAENPREVPFQLDAIFLLDRGRIINFGDGTGSFGVRNAEGVPYTGFYSIPSAADQNVLVWFLMWLYTSMPNILEYRSVMLKYLGRIMDDMEPA